MFSDYIEFTRDFNPYAVKIWAYDMIQIIEKFQGETISQTSKAMSR